MLFLEHPEVPIHNNFVERQINQYALGRKLWMFVYDRVGAQASANQGNHQCDGHGLLLDGNKNFRSGQCVIPLKPGVGPRGVPKGGNLFEPRGM